MPLASTFNCRRRTLWALIVIAATLIVSVAAGAENWTMQIRVDGQAYEGRLVGRDAASLMFQERDGALRTFDLDRVSDWKKTSSSFAAKTYRELKGDLQAEFGRVFVVTGASQYVVVHPRGGEVWAERLDDIYRSFFRFFELRGLRLNSPEFPLIAVVFPDKPAFDVYAREHGFELSPQVYGFYAPATNRVYLFDRPTPGATRGSWELGRQIVYHEASHQLAYNTGLHSRTGEMPQWLVEGLGTYFETKSVWSREPSTTQTRLHPDQAATYLAFVAKQKRPYLQDFVAKDALFQREPLDAYALSWALTYYLTEQNGAAYLKYMQKIASLPAGTEYDAKQRLTDFEATFGSNWQLLEANVARLVRQHAR
ncbi:MAG TPA: DUF1570 domain-containing protein [Pirellulaceae bacterium]|jgi:hypothetical protein|nr:DUF1570 domain-containing protein [Pirellulaceae bacterium]